MSARITILCERCHRGMTGVDETVTAEQLRDHLLHNGWQVSLQNGRDLCPDCKPTAADLIASIVGEEKCGWRPARRKERQ